VKLIAKALEYDSAFLPALMLMAELLRACRMAVQAHDAYKMILD